MRIIDLLESNPRILDPKSSEEEFVIAATGRFIRNYQAFQNHPVVKNEFPKFLKTKEKNINTPFGKKDTVFTDAGRLGLHGWWHAHILHGRVIVIYKPVGHRLILADITDHKSQDKGPASVRLGQYLQTVDIGLSGGETPANSTVTNLTDTELSDMGFKTSQEPSAPSAKIDLKQLESLIYTAATNAQDRQLMIAYRKGENDEFSEFIQLVPGADTLPRDQVNEIIDRALKDIPS